MFLVAYNFRLFFPLKFLLHKQVASEQTTELQQYVLRLTARATQQQPRPGYDPLACAIVTDCNISSAAIFEASLSQEADPIHQGDMPLMHVERNDQPGCHPSTKDTPDSV